MSKEAASITNKALNLESHIIMNESSTLMLAMFLVAGVDPRLLSPGVLQPPKHPLESANAWWYVWIQYVDCKDHLNVLVRYNSKKWKNPFFDSKVVFAGEPLNLRDSLKNQIRLKRWKSGPKIWHNHFGWIKNFLVLHLSETFSEVLRERFFKEPSKMF